MESMTAVPPETGIFAGRLHPLRPALIVALVFATIKIVLHVGVNLAAQHVGYGIFRDELYYLVCGRNLAWGYLDQPPFVGFQAHVTESLFGFHSLALLRIFPTLADALTAALTVLLAWAMGAGRTAQVLAGLAVLCSPMMTGISGFLSMNANEPVFWTGIALALVFLARRYAGLISAGRVSSPLLWLAIGVLGGVGLLNKWNIAFFLLAATAGLVLSPQRKMLLTPWLAAAALVATALALPNFMWEVHRHWPTLEWLHNDATEGKNIVLPPWLFLKTQIFAQNPLSVVLWAAGCIWLLVARAARPYRFLGLMFVVYLPAMLLMHAKDYYLSPVYPILFAAGGLAWESWLTRGWQRKALIPLYSLALLTIFVLFLPICQPVLKPASYVAYTRWLHYKTPETQTFDHAALPQFFADMLGWPQMADALANAYWSLTPEERKHAVIYGTNYGKASAVNIYRPDVPTAISGHQNYFYWGPRGHTGQIMIIIGDGRATDEREFESVTDYPWNPDPRTEEYEQQHIYICRNPKGWTLDKLWPKVKFWY